MWTALLLLALAGASDVPLPPKKGVVPSPGESSRSNVARALEMTLNAARPSLARCAGPACICATLRKLRFQLPPGSTVTVSYPLQGHTAPSFTPGRVIDCRLNGL